MGVPRCASKTARASKTALVDDFRQDGAEAVIALLRAAANQRGDGAQPHLRIRSWELLHILLIRSAGRPGRIPVRDDPDRLHALEL